MIWTPAATAELLRLYEIEPQLTFGEITAGLHAIGHKVTRNGVIGKAHRMLLPPRTLVIKPRRPRRKAQQYRRRRRVMTVLPKHVPQTAPQSHRTGLLIDLEWNQCRWPVADGPSGHSLYLSCTADAVPYKAYCEEHCAKAYQEVRRR